uniref:Uncharacterized protein MANES_12G112800 n=1 Tax=Rhizophora mucronata TaxID=61149 RepID=A0A2P2MBY4_RHIMU
MASVISERVELAKLCSSRDWSKAIRVLDSLLAQSSCCIQDICNRAFCYSQLELYKHVIKDCDRALKLDPTVLQAYILKGRAFLSLGKKEDALSMWEQGYEHALRQSADLRQLLELEELLRFAKQERSAVHGNHAMDFNLTVDISESGQHTNGKMGEFGENGNKLTSLSTLCSKSRDESEIPCKFRDNFETHNGISDKPGRKSLLPLPISEPFMNGKSCETYMDPYILKDKSKLCSQVASDVCIKSGENFEIRDGSSDKDGSNIMPDNQTNGILDSQMNGAHGALDKQNQDFGSYTNSSNSSELSNKLDKLSMAFCASGDTSEIRSKSSNRSDKHNESSDEPKRNRKFCVTRVPKTKSISVDFRLSSGIALVNEGKYTSAISIFDQILRDDPSYPEALIGRGTAYAFQREIEAAIADFSKAIQSNPSAGEAWKRRGQARAALGESIEAIEDLTKALEFEPESADILHERGIVNFKFRDFHAAIEDLSTCVKIDKDNKSAYTYLGLVLSSIGEYKRAEEAHLKSIQIDRNFLEAWAHLIQFYQELANSSKALECVQQVLQIDIRFAKVYHLRGLLLHGMGEHRKAVKDLSVALSIENSNVECLYLRASCYHAIGEYAAAVKDYDATLDLELDSMEKFVLQCLAFYQV